MDAAICVQGLELPGNGVEVRRFDLAVEPGEVIAIAGSPGVGKTTLLRLLSGRLPARARRLEVLGIDVQSEPRRVWENVGYLRGDQESFLGSLSARDNLRQHAAMKGLPAATLDREVARHLQRVGLDTGAAASLREFAPDDRFRLAMAHAWLDDPLLLLLDDPLYAASPGASEEFLATFAEWLDGDPNRTAVIVGRSVRAFAELCTRAFLLRERWLAPVSPRDLP